MTAFTAGHSDAELTREEDRKIILDGISPGTCRSASLGRVLLLLAVTYAIPASGQLTPNCTISFLNRTIPVNVDGSYVLSNIPANFGPARVLATCINNGVTTFGQSAPITVGSNGIVNAVAIQFGTLVPVPTSIAVTATQPMLSTAGATAQLAVTATYSDNSTQDVTPSASGTIYTTSNSATATVSSEGVVTAVNSGTVLISASNEGAFGVAQIQIVIGASTGGIPNNWAMMYGLDPNDPTMPMQDPDHDGLTNLQEFLNGTNPNNPDTDGDGLNDGNEVNIYKTNPALADTDGDGTPDGIEIQTGTNPLDPNSYDLTKAVATFSVNPLTFALAVSTVNPTNYVQLHVTGLLIDGKTTIDLSSPSRGTQYSVADASICTMGSPNGAIYPTSTSGTCVVTVTNSNKFFSATVTGTISSFAPVELSTIAVPGALAVDVAGNFAYVAAGTNGLTVVDVTNRAQPVTRGVLSGVGNAVGVRVAGQNVLIADATGFLWVVNPANPDQPVLLGSLAIQGAPNSLVIHGTVAAVAAQTGGVSLINLTNPATPTLISSIATPSAALGVDFDPSTGLGVVAMGAAGIQVIDISTISAPVLRGSLPGGSVNRVLMRSPAVLLADSSRSFTSVSLTNPDAPYISSSLPSGTAGLPTDIAAVGNIAITADTTFGRAIPITGISNPLLPASLGYVTLPTPGYSSSIAMDNAYGYLIVPALNLLRISQYQQITDTGGVPPTVSIVSPVSGPVLIQGQTINFQVNASDDVAVASVNFLVNGQAIFSTTNGIFSAQSIQYVVPSNVTTLDFGATAVDYGGNVGTAKDVLVAVIPDPLTTAVGQVLDSNNVPIAGATVTVFNLSTITAADGSFTLPGLPTIRGNIIAVAIGSDNGVTVGGVSAPVPPVLGGFTPLGIIQAVPGPVITSLSLREGLANSTVTGITVAGVNLLNATYALSPPNSAVTITPISVLPTGNSATVNMTIGAGVSGIFALVATTPGGSSSGVASSANTFNIFNLSPNDDTDHDGLTNAQEVQIGTDPTNGDTDGDGYIDGLEVLFGSNPLDPNSIPVIPLSGGAATVTLSILNTVDPGQDQSTPEVPTVTFSILNTVNPGQDQSTPEVPTVTFSLLNTVNPGQDQSTPEVPTVTFSLLNTVNPGQDQSTPEVPTVTFSLLNTVNPGTNQTTYSDGWVIFSALNTASGSPNAVPTATFTFTFLTGEKFQGNGPATMMMLRMLGGTTESRRKLLASFVGLDSDGDGLPDVLEIMFGSDPYNPDSDGDGLPDGIEYLLKGDPFSARPQDDDDNDGLTNLEEVRLHTDPSRPDTDGDGLTDGEEVSRFHTDPLRMDSDGDGFPDGLEIELGTDPLDPASHPTPQQLVPSTVVTPFNIQHEKPRAEADAGGAREVALVYDGSVGSVGTTDERRRRDK